MRHSVQPHITWLTQKGGQLVMLDILVGPIMLSIQVLRYHNLQNTLDPDLFQTARLSASSLRYYGLGLENGNYTVSLRFVEIAFVNSNTWQSLGRHVFDIYIQVCIIL